MARARIRGLFNLIGFGVGHDLFRPRAHPPGVSARTCKFGVGVSIKKKKRLRRLRHFVCNGFGKPCLYLHVSSHAQHSSLSLSLSQTDARRAGGIETEIDTHTHTQITHTDIQGRLKQRDKQDADLIINYSFCCCCCCCFSERERERERDWLCKRKIGRERARDLLVSSFHRKLYSKCCRPTADASVVRPVFLYIYIVVYCKFVFFLSFSFYLFSCWGEGQGGVPSQIVYIYILYNFGLFIEKMRR